MFNKDNRLNLIYIFLNIYKIIKNIKKMNNIELLDEIIENKFSYKSLLPTLKQFLEVEYCFLSNTESFNPSKIPYNAGIGFSSIENYFTFPKIFLKCIFNALDIEKKRKISFDNYVKGFLQIYTGTLEEKIKFIFDMFNINKDAFIYFDDIYLILNYTNIYDNKSQNNKMNSILKSFFGNKKYMDYSLFSQRILQNNYGLFIIILAIIFEHSNFNQEFTYIFDETILSNFSTSERKNRQKGNISNTCVMNSNLSNNQTLIKFNPPSLLYGKTGTLGGYSSKVYQQSTTLNSHIEVSDYIKANYSIDIYPFFSNSNLYQNNNQQPSQNITFHFTNFNNSNNNNFNKIKTNNSNNKKKDSNTNLVRENSITLSIIDYNNSNGKKESSEYLDLAEMFDEDMMDLNKFESDYLELKSCLLFEEAAMNKYRIPIGSSDFIVKSGVILSNHIKSSAKKNQNSLFHYSAHRNNISEDRTPKFNLNEGSSPLPDSLISSNKNVSNFTDFFKQTQISQNFFNDIFEEDVYVLNKNKDKMKRFSIFIIKHFIFVSGKKNEKIKIKYFIPLKNCYIGRNSDVIYIKDIKYYELVLVSTVQYRKRKFKIYFEKRKEINNISNFIIKETKYTVISSEYTFIKDIGKGTFSQIKLMKHNKTNKLYAIKKINKNVSSIDEYITINWEKDIVKFLMNYDCQNIVKFYDIIETIEHLYFIQEFIESGSLSNFIRKNRICLPSRTVRKIAFQIINGVKELHDYGIIHRDLKLENILLDYKDENHFKLKLIDFGLSVVLTSKARTNENYGTFIYSSPEVLLNLPYNNKIDCWSLGIIFFYLEYTFLPFNITGNEKENEQGIANKIVINELKFPRKIEGMNNEEEQNSKNIMVKVITECLDKNLNNRADIYTLYKTIKGDTINT